MIFLYFLSSTISYFWRVEYRKKVFRACAGGSGAKMVTQNTYPNLSNIVHTDFELGRVIQTVTAADPGITALVVLHMSPATSMGGGGMPGHAK